VVGCTDGSGEAWRSRGSRARGFVEAPIRGTHRGLRSLPTANEAGHMTASNPPRRMLNIPLASRGPSTHEGIDYQFRWGPVIDSTSSSLPPVLASVKVRSLEPSHSASAPGLWARMPPLSSR
jgi:hypothetical protein